jgi:hypothetical protein
LQVSFFQESVALIAFSRARLLFLEIDGDIWSSWYHERFSSSMQKDTKDIK